MSNKFKPFIYSVFDELSCVFKSQKTDHYNLIKHISGKTDNEVKCFLQEKTILFSLSGEQLEKSGYKIHSVYGNLFIWKLVKE